MGVAESATAKCKLCNVAQYKMRDRTRQKSCYFRGKTENINPVRICNYVGLRIGKIASSCFISAMQLQRTISLPYLSFLSPFGQFFKTKIVMYLHLNRIIYIFTIGESSSNFQVKRTQIKYGVLG